MNLERMDMLQARPAKIAAAALRYDRCVAGDSLRTVMSSIMRRRRGLISTIEKPVGL
jgi:hypothetical protein